ncbi:MAG: hypothetical protein IPK81_09295 [Rhodospirillales bacterium]|nr:MAG: hypothetical protein IPK81_09295 [Rhodospirillales bacterium]
MESGTPAREWARAHAVAAVTLAVVKGAGLAASLGDPGAPALHIMVDIVDASTPVALVLVLVAVQAFALRPLAPLWWLWFGAGMVVAVGAGGALVWAETMAEFDAPVSAVAGAVSRFVADVVSGDAMTPAGEAAEMWTRQMMRALISTALLGSACALAQAGVAVGGRSAGLEWIARAAAAWVVIAVALSFATMVALVIGTEAFLKPFGAALPDGGASMFQTLTHAGLYAPMLASAAAGALFGIVTAGWVSRRAPRDVGSRI